MTEHAEGSMEGASRRPTVVERLTALLDRAQELGEKPVVNPQKKPWTAPERPRGRTLWWGLGSFVLFLALAIFFIWFTGGQPGFIYEAF